MIERDWGLLEVSDINNVASDEEDLRRSDDAMSGELLREFEVLFSQNSKDSLHIYSARLRNVAVQNAKRTVSLYEQSYNERVAKLRQALQTAFLQQTPTNGDKNPNLLAPSSFDITGSMCIAMLHSDMRLCESVLQSCEQNCIGCLSFSVGSVIACNRVLEAIAHAHPVLYDRSLRLQLYLCSMVESFLPLLRVVADNGSVFCESKPFEYKAMKDAPTMYNVSSSHVEANEIRFASIEGADSRIFSCSIAQTRVSVVFSNSLRTYMMKGLQRTRILLESAKDLQQSAMGGTQLASKDYLFSFEGVRTQAFPLCVAGVVTRKDTLEIVKRLTLNLNVAAQVEQLLAGKRGCWLCLGDTLLAVCIISEGLPRTSGVAIAATVPLSVLFTSSEKEVNVAFGRESVLRRSATTSQMRRFGYLFTKATSLETSSSVTQHLQRSFTVEMWIHPTNLDERRSLYCHGNRETEEVFLELVPHDGCVIWRGGNRTPQQGMVCASHEEVSKVDVLNRWHHVALVCTGQRWLLYVNAQEVDSKPGLRPNNGVRPCDGCSIAKCFVGCIAEVRVWKTAVTQDTLRLHYHRNVRSQNPFLLIYYPLNEGFGSIVVDRSANALHATISKVDASKWVDITSTFPAETTLACDDSEDVMPSMLYRRAKDVVVCSNDKLLAVGFYEDAPSWTVLEYAIGTRCLVSAVAITQPKNSRLDALAYEAPGDELFAFGRLVDSQQNRRQKLGVWRVKRSLPVPVVASISVPSHNCCSYFRSCLKRFGEESRSWLTSVERSAGQPDTATVERGALLFGQQLNEAMLTIIKISLILRKTPYEEERRACFAMMQAMLRCAVIRNESWLDELHKCSASSILSTMSREEESLSVDSATLLSFCFNEIRNVPCHESHAMLAEVLPLVANDATLLEIVSAASKDKSMDALQRAAASHYSTTHQIQRLLETCDSATFDKYCQAVFDQVNSECLAAIQKRLDVDLLKSSSFLVAVQVLQEVVVATAVASSKRGAAPLASYATALLGMAVKLVVETDKVIRLNSSTTELCCAALNSSYFGTLLPEFVVALPLVGTETLAAVTDSVERLRTQFITLCEVAHSTLPNQRSALRWMKELVHGLDFLCCQTACMMVWTRVPEESEEQHRLLRGGLRRSGSSRDASLRNLIQGVGTISRVFAEIAQMHHNPRFGEGTALAEVERAVMAAFCNVNLTTDVLQAPTVDDLEPVFQHVLKFRTWLLSARQDDPDISERVRIKALLLCRFEVPLTIVQPSMRSSASRKPVAASTGSDRKQWRRMIASWKAMRQLRSLVSTIRTAETAQTCTDDVERFLQSANVDVDGIEKAIQVKTTASQHRAFGLHVLFKLLDELKHDRATFRTIAVTISQNMAGKHYLHGITGCGAETIGRVRGMFFQLVGEVVMSLESSSEELFRVWADLTLALLAVPWNLGDYEPIQQLHAPNVLLSLCSCVEPREVWQTLKTVGEIPAGAAPLPCKHSPVFNHSIPQPLACNTFSSSVVSGINGTLVRWNSGRGCCIASCGWPVASDSSLRQCQCLFYEVTIVELARGGSVAVGLGPAKYNLSRPAGWDSESCAYHGDDGMLYFESSNGRFVGSQFGVGDTIGCGIDLATYRVFWTKNGKITTLQVADFKFDTCPLIGMESSGVVRANFGTQPFQFPLASLFGDDVLPKRPLRSRAWDVFVSFSLTSARVMADAAHLKGASHVQKAVASVESTVSDCMWEAAKELHRCCHFVLVAQEELDEHIAAVCSLVTTLVQSALPHFKMALLSTPLSLLLESLVVLLTAVPSPIARSAAMRTLRVLSPHAPPQAFTDAASEVLRRYSVREEGLGFVDIVETLGKQIVPMAQAQCSLHRFIWREAPPPARLWLPQVEEEAISFLRAHLGGSLTGECESQWQQIVQERILSCLSGDPNATMEKAFLALSVLGGTAPSLQLGNRVQLYSLRGEEATLLNLNVDEGFAEVLSRDTRRTVSANDVVLVPSPESLRPNGNERQL